MNDNTSNILFLSFQKRKLTADMSDDEYASQLRISITSFLNKVASGQKTMTPEVVAAINSYNRIVSTQGYPTIDYQHLT